MIASTIFYNDPTRYEYPDLSVTWGIGTPNDYYLENIGEILDKIFKLNNIENSNVIFYSSSGGGFMSIYLATIIPDSIALADIPQTNLRNYSTYRETVETIFKDESNLGKFRYRFDCAEYIKRREYVPKVYLVMSCGFQDVFFHDIPFIDALRKLDYYDTKNNKLKILINPKRSHAWLNINQFFYLTKKYSNFDKFEDIPDLSILESDGIFVCKNKLEEDIPLYKDGISRLVGELEKLNILYSKEQKELINSLNEKIKLLEKELDK